MSLIPKSDDIWMRDEPQSPCIKICAIHPKEKICVGCLRTLDEITRWGSMSAQERQALMKELSARAPRLKKRRGGREGR